MYFKKITPVFNFVFEKDHVPVGTSSGYNTALSEVGVDQFLIEISNAKWEQLSQANLTFPKSKSKTESKASLEQTQGGDFLLKRGGKILFRSTHAHWVAPVTCPPPAPDRALRRRP